MTAHPLVSIQESQNQPFSDLLGAVAAGLQLLSYGQRLLVRFVLYFAGASPP